MLNNLIIGVLGTTANDVRSAGALLDGDRILAYILKPDISDGAGTLAMDALVLVCTDHDVAVECMREFGRSEPITKANDSRDSGARLEDEDSILGPSLLLATALYTTAVA